MKRFMKEGMKLCPFCARQPDVTKVGMMWVVFCKCGCEAPRDSKSENGAKRVWNRRRSPALPTTKGQEG